MVGGTVTCAVAEVTAGVGEDWTRDCGGSVNMHHSPHRHTIKTIHRYDNDFAGLRVETSGQEQHRGYGSDGDEANPNRNTHNAVSLILTEGSSSSYYSVQLESQPARVQRQKGVNPNNDIDAAASYWVDVTAQQNLQLELSTPTSCPTTAIWGGGSTPPASLFQYTPPGGSAATVNPFTSPTQVREVQKIATTAAATMGGTITVSFGGQTTPALSAAPDSLSAADMQTALQALTTVGRVSATRSAITSQGYEWTVTFDGWTHGNDGDVPMMSCNAKAATGTSAACAVTQITAGSLELKEKQTVTSSATVDNMAGTFTLTFGGQTTGNLAAAVSAVNLATAINGLSTVGTCTVTRSAKSATTFGYTYTIIFDGSTNKGNVDAFLCANSLTSSGGTTACAVATIYDGATGHYSSTCGGWKKDATLRFTADNWNVPQYVYVSAHNDRAGSSGGVLHAVEVQTVTVFSSAAITGGTFTVTLGGQTTVGISPTADAAAFKAAIDALSTVGTVAVVRGAYASYAYAYAVTFDGTTNVGDVGAFTCTVSALTGAGTEACAVAETLKGMRGAVTDDLNGNVKEVQSVTVSATADDLGGTFKLTLGAGTTASLAFDATAAQVKTALDATLGVGTVAVTRSAKSTVTFGYEFTIEFDGSTQVGDQHALVCTYLSGVGSTLSGTGEACAVAEVRKGGTGKVQLHHTLETEDSEPNIGAGTLSAAMTYRYYPQTHSQDYHRGGLNQAPQSVTVTVTDNDNVVEGGAVAGCRDTSAVEIVDATTNRITGTRWVTDYNCKNGDQGGLPGFVPTAATSFAVPP